MVGDYDFLILALWVPVAGIVLALLLYDLTSTEAGRPSLKGDAPAPAPSGPMAVRWTLSKA